MTLTSKTGRREFSQLLGIFSLVLLDTNSLEGEAEANPVVAWAIIYIVGFFMIAVPVVGVIYSLKRNQRATGVVELENREQKGGVQNFQFWIENSSGKVIFQEVKQYEVPGKKTLKFGWSFDQTLEPGEYVLNMKSAVDQKSLRIAVSA